MNKRRRSIFKECGHGFHISADGFLMSNKEIEQIYSELMGEKTSWFKRLKIWLGR